MGIQANSILEATKPDTTVAAKRNKNTRKYLFLDVTVPGDHNIQDKALNTNSARKNIYH